MADSEEAGGTPVRKPRRSPSTGHRRKRVQKEEVGKRSQSSPREKSDKLTSSEEDLIEKCKELVEQTKVVKRKTRKVEEERVDKRPEDEQPLLEGASRPLPWWKSLFAKKEVKEEPPTEVVEKKEVPKVIEVPREPIKWKEVYREIRLEYRKFQYQFKHEVLRIYKLRNRCISDLLIMIIYCGLGAFVFKFTEGTFESFYKCGVKRVKRDFIDELWRGSHHLREDEWKSKARKKMMDFENQLQDAFEAGMNSYSGQRSWSFMNALLYCLTVVTTIGYGHIAPVTTTGRALTIAYSIIGIPLFLILLADFGKMFTRGIKFLWAFVRRLYYTGSCRKVRRTGPVQEVMKGVQIMYDLAHLRRPSQIPPGEEGAPPLPPRVPVSPSTDNPPTPALSAYAIDDEFNLPISVAIFILLIYIFLGAVVFWVWEDDWTFFEAFYFVFISMSTIGFGDLVPQNQMYMMASIVYLAFGLALTSMCINVVQEKLSDTFRQASAKIGATIGLKVSEDDGTISPVSATNVEIADVHRPQLPSSPHSVPIPPHS